MLSVVLFHAQIFYEKEVGAPRFEPTILSKVDAKYDGVGWPSASAGGSDWTARVVGGCVRVWSAKLGKLCVKLLDGLP